MISKHKGSILLVDDKLENLKVLRAILNQEGYKVHPALTGELALNTLKKIHPDLILLDVVLPDIDGYTICRKIKEDDELKNIPVIFISVIDDTESIIKALQAGALDYISKPFKEEEVLARVQTHINLVKLQQKLIKKNIEAQKEIKKRHQIERKLKAEKEKAQQYLEIVGVIIVALDKKGNIKLINKCGADLLGYPEKTLIEKNWLDEFIPDQDKEKIKKLFKDLINDEKENYEYFENNIKTKDNGVRLIEWRNTLIKNNKGKITGILSSGTDITERKKAELERITLTDQLVEKNKELEQLIYVTSHDLRSPLVNIQGFSSHLKSQLTQLIELLNNDPASPDKKEKINTIINNQVSKSLNFIINSSTKMNQLLNGLLSFLKIGCYNLKLIKLDMNQIIKDVLFEFEYITKEKNITIITRNLPECIGDPIHLSQVFTNIIDNAIKYIKKNEQGLITISGETKDNVSIYKIKDNGIGVPQKNINDIFQIFYRLDPKKTDGLGLGLNIASKILKMHNGKIWLESEHGTGSTFYIQLPHKNK